jgi:uncharacterized protein (DUF1684 family)
MIFKLLRYTVFLFILSFSLQNCSDSYEKETQNWRQERFKELKAPYAWPSVVGLYAIQDSLTTFGSNTNNNVIIEKGPASFGYLSKVASGVAITRDPGSKGHIDGEEFQSVNLKTDRHPDGPSYGTYNSLQWHIIDREGNYFLRVKDTLSTYRNTLTSIPSYPIDKNYRIEGTVDEKIPSHAKLSYKNILGMDITTKIAAVIKFQWQGKEYALTGTNSGDENYMVMVHDMTTGIDTYGGGRYLYPKKADQNGKVILDFNKLENPPCVFTPYATCPLPPKRNHLPFELLAGEKMLHLY